MARMIDADALQELCNRRIQDTWNSGVAPVSWAEAYEDFKNDIDSMPTITQPNEEIVEKIDSVTWYTLTEDGKMEEGAPSRRTAWYKARDILSITDKYRRPPEGEEDT